MADPRGHPSTPQPQIKISLISCVFFKENGVGSPSYGWSWIRRCNRCVRLLRPVKGNEPEVPNACKPWLGHWNNSDMDIAKMIFQSLAMSGMHFTWAILIILINPHQSIYSYALCLFAACQWGDRYMDCRNADCSDPKIRDYCCETCSTLSVPEATTTLSPLSPGNVIWA